MWPSSGPRVSICQQPNHRPWACHAWHGYVKSSQTQSQNKNCIISLLTHEPFGYGNQYCKNEEPHEQKIVAENHHTATKSQLSRIQNHPASKGD